MRSRSKLSVHILNDKFTKVKKFLKDKLKSSPSKYMYFVEETQGQTKSPIFKDGNWQEPGFSGESSGGIHPEM